MVFIFCFIAEDFLGLLDRVPRGLIFFLTDWAFDKKAVVVVLFFPAILENRAKHLKEVFCWLPLSSLLSMLCKSHFYCLSLWQIPIWIKKSYFAFSGLCCMGNWWNHRLWTVEKPWLSFSLCICHHFDPFGQHSNLPDGSTLCYLNPGEFYLPMWSFDDIPLC